MLKDAGSLNDRNSRYF